MEREWPHWTQMERTRYQSWMLYADDLGFDASERWQYGAAAVLRSRRRNGLKPRKTKGEGKTDFWGWIPHGGKNFRLRVPYE